MSLDLIMPVLVVGDYKITCRIATNALHRIGYDDVDHVCGDAALARLDARRYGLVIGLVAGCVCDAELSTATAVLRHVRTDATLSHLPFLMAMAEATPADAASAKEAGANAVIAMPFGLNTLKCKLEFVVGRALDFGLASPPANYRTDVIKPQPRPDY